VIWVVIRPKDKPQRKAIVDVVLVLEPFLGPCKTSIHDLLCFDDDPLPRQGGRSKYINQTGPRYVGG